MSSHTNDTKLVKVNAPIYGGYHASKGGYGYTDAGLKLSRKFGGKTVRQPVFLDRPHMTIRKVNVPDNPKAAMQGGPTKMDRNNPKISFDTQKLPPTSDTEQAGLHFTI